MPTPTYDLIASSVLTGSVSSVSFTSLPSTYRDLVVVMKAGGGTQFWMRINSDSTSNYFHLRMRGDGSSTNSGIVTEAVAEFMQSFSATALMAIVNLMDYSATDKNKVVLARGGNAAAATSLQAIRWGNTNAITSIEFVSTPGTLVSGTTFYVYGIAS